jgi:hypothetical protein
LSPGNLLIFNSRTADWLSFQALRRVALQKDAICETTFYYIWYKIPCKIYGKGYPLIVVNFVAIFREALMEDLWRVKGSSVDMKDLADLAEYHRFLDRFKEEEVDDNKRNLLYGDARLDLAREVD